MECLQYSLGVIGGITQEVSFKPCYKWNAFNTGYHQPVVKYSFEVLNLVISGMPSILENEL